MPTEFYAENVGKEITWQTYANMRE